MTKLAAKYAPLKKVSSGFIAAAAIYLAHRFLHLDLGPEHTREAIESIVGVAVAYAVEDPRVQPYVDMAETLVEKGEAVEHALANPSAPAA